MRRRLLRIFCLIGGFTVASGIAAPSAVGATTTNLVASTMTGAGTFAVAVSLPSMPCGGCSGGSFAGQVGLSLSGVSTAGLPYSAIWIAPVPPATNTASSAFSYDEACIGQVSGLPPALGSAGGFFSVTGGSAVVGTQMLSPATLSGTFNWSRVGVSANIQFTGLTITAGAAATQVAINLMDFIIGGVAAGEGGSAIRWTNGPGLCPGPPQQPQTAQIVGVSLQPF